MSAGQLLAEAVIRPLCPTLTNLRRRSALSPFQDDHIQFPATRIYVALATVLTGLITLPLPRLGVQVFPRPVGKNIAHNV